MRTREKRLTVLSVSVVLAALIGFCPLAGCNGTPAEQSPAAPPLPEVSVATPIQRSTVEWDKYTGRLAAVQSVEVRARVSGHLQSIHFAEGQDIQQGDLLFIIDPRPLEASLNSAQAQLNQAEAELKEAQSLRRQAEAQKAQADAAEQLARQRQERAESLLRQNAMSEEEYDQRTSELAQARADVEAAVASIEAANANIETAKATIVVEQAAVENAELELDYTEIRAPISGRISNRLVTSGNLINGGSSQSTLLTTIVSLDPIHCYFDANEREVLNYMRMISAGERKTSRQGEFRSPVYMKLADEAGYPHLGHIDFVDNRIDTNTGTMRARAIFPNPDRLLTPGMFAEVRLPGSSPEDTILIPDAAVGSDQSDTYVYVVADDDTVERRTVELGPLSHGLRVIRQGLTAGDRLVISGLQAIRPGAHVRTKPAPAIEWEEDGTLPNTVEPVPQSGWLSVNPEPAAIGVASDEARPGQRNR